MTNNKLKKLKGTLSNTSFSKKNFSDRWDEEIYWATRFDSCQTEKSQMRKNTTKEEKNYGYF